eukprot:TCONS_00022917-protein
MPKKDRLKISKLPKPLLPEKEVRDKHFKPTVDKQVTFKEYSQHFEHWTPWQRKILFCQFTSQSTVSLLVSLSTIMEPVFHRDYQVSNTGTFTSSLIHNFSTFEPLSEQSQPEKDEGGKKQNLETLSTASFLRKDNSVLFQGKRQSQRLSNVSKIDFNKSFNRLDSLKSNTLVIEKSLHILDGRSSPKTRRTSSRVKSPFSEIHIEELPLKDDQMIDHKHEEYKHKDSVSTIDFFAQRHGNKVATLGSFVRTTKNYPMKPTAASMNYKHKQWYLPPIKRKQTLLKASKSALLKDFKDLSKEVVMSYRKWTNAEQGDFILSLLEFCQPEEITYLGNCIQQRLREIGDINRLPDKVLLNVFSYLDKKDLHSCSQTCKRWKYLAFHDTVWKEMCYQLAEQYNQHGVLQYLENISVDFKWKNIYKDLENTVQQLVDATVLQPVNGAIVPSQNHGGCIDAIVEEDEDEYIESPEPVRLGKGKSSRLAKVILGVDSKTRMSDLAEEDDEEAEDEEDNYDENMFTEYKHIHRHELSPTRSFGTFGSENSKEEVQKVFTAAASGTEKRAVHKQSSTMNHVSSDTNFANELAFDVRSKLVQPINIRHESSYNNTKRTPDENFMSISIQGVRSLKRVRKLQGHLEAVLAVQFDRKRVMSGSMDRTIRLWDARSGRNFYKLKGHQGGVRCIQFDDEYIVTGSWDTTCIVWHISRFTLLHTINEHTGAVACLEMNKEFLITGSHDNSICIFERGTWKLLKRLIGHKGPVSCMAFVSEEELITGSHDMRVILWNMDTGENLREFYLPKSPILTVKICGNLIAAGCLDGTLNFWNKTTGCPEGRIKAHNGAVHAVCFIAKRFVTGGGDNLVKEWDLSTCTCIRSLTGHKGPVLCLRASHKRIISGSSDGTIRIWDMICVMQQIGGPYDDIRKIIIPSETINERQWKERKDVFQDFEDEV